MADIARTLTAERGDSADAEVLAWAEAVRAGHRKSRARSRHGSSLGAAVSLAKLSLNRATTPEQELGSTTIARVFSRSRPWPTRRTAARPPYSELAALRAHAWRSDSAAQSDALARHRCDHRGSRTFCRSLWSAGPPPFDSRPAHQDDVRRRWSLAFSSTPTRKLFSIGYRVADNSLDPVVTICWRLRRGSQASSPLPRATFRRPIGFTSAAL